MSKYWAVVTVSHGPTLADITIDGTFVPLGPSDLGGFGGHRVIDSSSDPISFIFHARGPKGFPVTLGIVLSPLPTGADIKFNPPDYKIPESEILAITDGKIPVKTPATASLQSAIANLGTVAAPVKTKPIGRKGGA